MSLHLRSRAIVVTVAVPVFFACGEQHRPVSEMPPPSAAAAAPALTPAEQPPAHTTAGIPPAHPSLDRAPALPRTPAETREAHPGLAWNKPASWVPETPKSPMRRAQYRVPAATGDAECVVFYFGPGQGGDPMANARRWASQFRPPNGQPSRTHPQTSRLAVGSIGVLLVEIKGTYLGGMAMGGQRAQERPGYMLLGAVAEGPAGSWFFKFTGPEKTVEAQRAAFEEMIRSLRTVP